MKSLLLPLFLFIGWSSMAQPGFFEKSELIFPLQSKHVHSSSLVELPNGDLLAVWFEGSGERTADDVMIMGARLQKGHNKWSRAFNMADTPGIPDCNPVIFLNQEGRLFLIWIAVHANAWENSVLRVRSTDDYSSPGPPNWTWQDIILLKPGKDFAKEVETKFGMLPENTNGWAAYAPQYDRQIIAASQNLLYRSLGWMTRTLPLFEDGKILLPLYSDGLNMSMLAVSEDHGLTWRPSLPLVGRGPIQPALAKRKNGDIVAYMRDSGDEPNQVKWSLSSDGGMSWTPARRTDIPNTASVIIKKLKSGRWIFVGNDVDDGRYQLSLRLSSDEGRHWGRSIFLEKVDRGKGSFSYPCLVQTEDGFLHFTYSYHLSDEQKSIKHVVVNPVLLDE